MLCVSLPIAVRPLGRNTNELRPQCAAYAAAEALVLPVDAHRIARDPSSIAFATARTMPRSLKEPVGLQLSSLKYSSLMPREGPMRVDLTRGVLPSPRSTIGVAEVRGR